MADNWFGNLLDTVGTALNLPELGLSESASGGRTANTGRIDFNTSNLLDFNANDGTYRPSAGSNIRVTSNEYLNWKNANQPSGNGPTPGGGSGGGQSDPYGNTTGVSGSGGGGASYSQEDVAYIDDLIANYNRQMGRTTSGLDTGLSTLESSFNKETSRQNEARGRALEDFSTRRSDTDLAKQNAIGKVDTNARTLADSLRRRLGMAGGTDSSAFKFAAPNAVARQASGERGDVLTNYGQNYRDLATAENKAKSDFENLLADLAEEKRSRETGLRSGVLEQQNKISEALANAAREKASIMGGGYGAARNASQQYTNDIASRETAIDNLLRGSVTPYSVKDVQVNTPSLRDYTVDRAAINANQGTGSTYSPYEQLLKKRNEDQTLA